MTLPVIVLRPEPGATVSVERARDLNLEAHAFPLFEVRPLTWQPVPRSEVDAVLLGSANALRHGGEALGAYRGLPAYAVGETTAEAARRAGLDVVETGIGGLQPMLDTLHPGHRRLLRLAGRERITLELPPATVLHTCEVYASEPLPLSTQLKACLARRALVLLHSGEAAEHFAKLCDRANISRRHIMLAAIGQRVAARSGTGWAAVRYPAQPSDAALLALAAQMCKEAGSGLPLPKQGQAAD